MGRLIHMMLYIHEGSRCGSRGSYALFRGVMLGAESAGMQKTSCGCANGNLSAVRCICCDDSTGHGAVVV